MFFYCSRSKFTFGAGLGAAAVLLLALLDFHNAHLDVLDLGLGVGQHLLRFGQQLLVARRPVAVLLDHVLAALLHLSVHRWRQRQYIALPQKKRTQQQQQQPSTTTAGRQRPFTGSRPRV